MKKGKKELGVLFESNFLESKKDKSVKRFIILIAATIILLWVFYNVK